MLALILAAAHRRGLFIHGLSVSAIYREDGENTTAEAFIA